MRRREVLKAAVSAALPLPTATAAITATAATAAMPTAEPFERVRPGMPGWPAEAQWAQLNSQLGGRLIRLGTPLAMTKSVRAELANPFFVGDTPELTQTSGWVDAWQSQPSSYAVAAHDAADVAAAVNFAREHQLRLVIKGGGHSYQGTSCAPDSLLIWTRAMNSVAVIDGFVPQGGEGKMAPQPAVSVGAGAMWADAYDAVTTRAGRYVQGGGCTTVGVAGLVQSGGFGSFSKAYGTAAAGLLEAEVVTADGRVRIVNAFQDPELFWGLKGGGGGSLAVVTRLTLRTRELPENFGAVFGTIEADSDDAYRALIARVVEFCRENLVNRHWGEQIKLEGEKALGLSLVFQGLSREQAMAVWQPFVDWVKARPEYRLTRPLQVLVIPARHFWDAPVLNRAVPGVMVPDDRSGAPPHHAVWAGDRDQVGWFIHGYHSAWLPADLLKPERQGALVDALFECKRYWDVALHLNKGLAGASADDIDAARDTATHPQVLNAFALAIVAGGAGPAYAGLPAPDLTRARRSASTMERAAARLLKVAPLAGAYVSESDFFQSDWQQAFWGANYARLLAAKRRYDPEGLFFVHHGVGSEGWSEDGFSRLV
ncbi:MAG: FAD-dependent oxidoreductase [Paucibacter sp.]|nr:FAD-dependent oxidoreductase [Roseateles sp.]